MEQSASKKLIVAKLVRKIPPFMETEDQLPCSRLHLRQGNPASQTKILCKITHVFHPAPSSPSNYWSYCTATFSNLLLPLTSKYFRQHFSLQIPYTKESVQKFPDWPPGARTV